MVRPYVIYIKNLTFQTTGPVTVPTVNEVGKQRDINQGYPIKINKY